MIFSNPAISDWY